MIYLYRGQAYLDGIAALVERFSSSIPSEREANSVKAILYRNIVRVYEESVR